MHDEALMFLDCTCPICGRTAGNGGHGYTYRCVCGWMRNGISQHDKRLIEQALARFREKNNTEETT